MFLQVARILQKSLIDSYDIFFISFHFVCPRTPRTAKVVVKKIDLEGAVLISNIYNSRHFVPIFHHRKRNINQHKILFFDTHR